MTITRRELATKLTVLPPLTQKLLTPVSMRLIISQRSWMKQPTSGRAPQKPEPVIPAAVSISEKQTLPASTNRRMTDFGLSFLQELQDLFHTT